MKQSEFIKLAKSSHPVNTTNGWGFGGWFGKKHSYNDGVNYLNGKCGRRHGSPYPYKKWECEGVEIDKKPLHSSCEVLEVFYKYPDVDVSCHTFVWFDPSSEEIPELANKTIPAGTKLEDFKVRQPFK